MHHSVVRAINSWLHCVYVVAKWSLTESNDACYISFIIVIIKTYKLPHSELWNWTGRKTVGIVCHCCFLFAAVNKDQKHLILKIANLRNYFLLIILGRFDWLTMPCKTRSRAAVFVTLYNYGPLCRETSRFVNLTGKLFFNLYDRFWLD